MAERSLSPLGARRTVAEVKDELDAERNGVPFLMYRDEHGVQRIVTLEGCPAKKP